MKCNKNPLACVILKMIRTQFRTGLCARVAWFPKDNWYSPCKTDPIIRDFPDQVPFFPVWPEVAWLVDRIHQQEKDLLARNGILATIVFFVTMILMIRSGRKFAHLTADHYMQEQRHFFLNIYYEFLEMDIRSLGYRQWWMQQSRRNWKKTL